jgi:sugar lactone lactonase YvrE
MGPQADLSSCTADIEGNDTEFIFGGKFGYGICNRSTGEYRWIKKVWSDDEIADGKPDRMRGNDGAVDSQGRFWVGFMNDPLVAEVKDEGTFLSYPPSHIIGSRAPMTLRQAPSSASTRTSLSTVPCPR